MDPNEVIETKVTALDDNNAQVMDTTVAENNEEEVVDITPLDNDEDLKNQDTEPNDEEKIEPAEDEDVSDESVVEIAEEAIAAQSDSPFRESDEPVKPPSPWTASVIISLLTEFFSLSADAAYFIAITILMLSVSSVVTMGFTLMLGYLPRLIILIFSDTFERFSPKKLMVTSNAVRAIAVCIQSWLLAQGHQGGKEYVVIIFVLIYGIADAFYFPALSLFPALSTVYLRNISKINAAVQVVNLLAVATGSWLGGWLISIYYQTDKVIDTIWPAFLIIGLTQVVAFILLLFTKFIDASLLQHPPLPTLKDSFKEARREGSTYEMLIFVAITSILVSGIGFAGIPALAKDIWNSPTVFGMLFSSWAIGNIIGAIVSLFVSVEFFKAPWFSIIIVVSTCAIAACFGIFTYVIELNFLYSANFLVGVLDTFNIFIIFQWFRSMTHMPRLANFLLIASQGTQPLGIIIQAILYEIFEKKSFLYASIAIAVMSITMVFFRSFRNAGPQEYKPLLDSENSEHEV
ncbi:hypothetical protein PCE1_002487 [Barthelona sp. PCE]